MNVKGKRVLIFGDSLTHRGADDAPRDVIVNDQDVSRDSSPGDLLGSWLLVAGATAVRLHAKIGRSANNFWSNWEPDHDEVIQSLQSWQPDIVIVFLGTNDLGLAMSVDGPKMAKIRDAFLTVGAEVWCIGPPSFSDIHLAALTPAVVAMERAVFGGKFIDSRPLTATILSPAEGRARDGVHFTQDGAVKYAIGLARSLSLGEVSYIGPIIAGVVIIGGFVGYWLFNRRRRQPR